MAEKTKFVTQSHFLNFSLKFTRFFLEIIFKPIFFYLFQANKIGLTPFFCHNGDHLTTPPPAHCGIPPYQIDPKTMGEFQKFCHNFAIFQILAV